MRWAALIDGVVIYGIGRAVRAVYAENAETRAIAVKAEEAYTASPYIQGTVPKEVFVPGMISALLMRDTYPANPQPLSAFTMNELLARGDAERKALAIYNATLTSPLAFDDDGEPRNDQAIATELGLLWKQERLLRYPQDHAAVENIAVQQALPGALLRALGHRRSLLSTFTREARREVEARASVASGKKEIALSDAEGEAVEPIVAAIETAAMRIGEKLRQAADEHRRAFNFQMREMAGMELADQRLEDRIEQYYGDGGLEESDVEEEILSFQEQFLKSMLRLSNDIYALVEPIVQRAEVEQEEKALKPDQPLLTQVEQNVEREEASVLRRFKQRLDQKRQRRAGVRRYIWRSQDDDKVRASHAVNDDRIFEWDNPPPTGHPGDDYGCRCSAEPILDDVEEPRFDPRNEVQVAGLGNVVTFVLKQILKRGSQIRKIPKLPKRLPRVGRPNSQWKFGKHKSETKWKNQMEQRGWTEEEITDTIKYGKEYKAPNRVRNNDPEATATRYEKDGKFVVRDDQTGEILQISGDKFEPLKF